jgi:hypothetical protein
MPETRRPSVFSATKQAGPSPDEKLKEQIAALDRSDPSSLAERYILQQRYAAMLGMAQAGTPAGTRVRHHAAGRVALTRNRDQGQAARRTAPSQPTSTAMAKQGTTTLTIPIAKAQGQMTRSGQGAFPKVGSRLVLLGWKQAQWQGMLDWCNAALADSLTPQRKYIRQLRGPVQTMLTAKKPKARERLTHEIWTLLQVLKGGGRPTKAPPANPGPGPAPPGSSQGRRGSATTGGRTGESFAMLNRLSQFGRGMSYDESLAVRQAPRSQQRRLVSQIDRAMAGNRDDQDDVDW